MTTKKFTVYSFPPPAPQVAKAAIAGKFGGIEIEFAPGFELGKTNKTEEYLLKNPAGEVPTLDTPEGSIFESNAIAYFVARSGTDAVGLLGDTPYAQSQIDQWVCFARSWLENLFPLYGFFFPGYGKYDAVKGEEVKKKVCQGFEVLEFYLKSQSGRKFIINNRVTLADIVIGCSVVTCIQVGTLDDESVWKNYPKTKAYLVNVFEQEQVKSILGEIKFTVKWSPPSS